MAISPEWMEWTRSNHKKGASIAELREFLQNKGFAEKDIKYAFKKTVSANVYKRTVDAILAREKNGGCEPGTDYEALANPRLVRNADGESIIAQCETELQLFTVPNLLNADQCNALIEIIRENAHPSRVDGYKEQSEMRSSSTCNLAVQDHPIIAEIDDIISQSLGLSLGWSECNQGQWYEPGQQYKPHPDYFPPGTREYTRFVSLDGQRTWTFMIYLNKTERGGGTYFTKINKTLMPEQGTAVCWNNLLRNGQPNPRTEHAGLPVEAGTKFIVTKWFRDRGEGPPLID